PAAAETPARPVAAAPSAAPSAAPPAAAPAAPATPTPGPAAPASPAPAAPTAPARPDAATPAAAARPAPTAPAERPRPPAPPPPSRAAAPASPAAGGTPDVTAVQRVWEEILKRTWRRSKRVAAVAREATVRDVAGDTLMLTFQHAFHANMLSNTADPLVEAIYEVL